MTRNKFELIQNWKNENGGLIEKFDDISQIKGITKKTVENLRRYCEAQLQADAGIHPENKSLQPPVSHEAEINYFHQDFQSNRFANESDNNFLIYDESIEPTHFTQQKPSSYKSHPSGNSYSENQPKNFKTFKLVLEPKLKRHSPIRSFTSIYQDATAITCTRFKANGEWEDGISIDSWNFHKVASVGAKQLNQICDNLSEMVNRLPASDIYIMDDHVKVQHFRKSVTPKRVVEIVQMSQQCAILVALLQCKNQQENSEPKQPSVYFMGYSAVGRLYDLFVGREAISTQSIIQSILQSSCISPRIDGIQSHEGLKIEINNDIKNSYFQSYPVERECLGKSMLLGLTFIQLSLVKVNKKSSQSM